MAPATFAGAAPQVRTTGRGGWTATEILIAIQEWVATYGEPPRAADWNPSSAKWSGQLWRVERYRAGRADGSPWPALNSAKRPFGGSLNAAVRAAGFEPAKPGPRRRTDVDVEQAGRAQMSPEGRAMLAAAQASARESERRVAVLEDRLAKARAKAEVKPKVVRERVVDAAAVARATRRADVAEAKAASGRAAATEARAAATRLAARLERSEATVSTLRGDRRELATEAGHLAGRVAELESALAKAKAEAEDVRVMPEVVTVRQKGPGAAALREARLEASRCARAAEAAERRAIRAERELRETAAAVRAPAGRRLTGAELAELRSGPASAKAGPAVLAEALKALTAARAANSPTALREALALVTQAAVTWQDRIGP